MKKLLLILFVSLSMGIIAQGQLFVGGNVNFNTQGGVVKDVPESGSTTSVDKGRLTNFAFNPQIGMFLSDNLAVGVGLIFESSVDSDDDYKDSEMSLGLVPFVRYYIADFNKIRVYTTTSLGISSGSSKITNSGTTVEGPKSTKVSFNISPAASYSLSNKIDLEVGVAFYGHGIYNEYI
jgi:outer membrane protein